MKLVFEYEKANACDEGPDTIYKVIEIKNLTRKARKKKNPRKILEILTEIKETMFDNSNIVINTKKTIKYI